MLVLFFLSSFLMVAWYAMRQKCHISNAKWIIAPTQLNQMPLSDLRPSSHSWLVNLHRAWFGDDCLVQKSRNCFFSCPSRFQLKPKHFFHASIWAVQYIIIKKKRNSNFSKEQILTFIFFIYRLCFLVSVFFSFFCLSIHPAQF